MFAMCTDPDSLTQLDWMLCYLTTGKHMGLYYAFGTVL